MHREIAIDDRVHQRVEHVGGPVLQQLRLLLAAATHVREAQLRVAPHRDDVLRPDENRRLRRSCRSSPSGSIKCSTMKSDEPYSSIFGR